MLVWVKGENPELSMTTLRRVGSKVLYSEKVSYTVYVTYSFTYWLKSLKVVRTGFFVLVQQGTGSLLVPQTAAQWRNPDGNTPPRPPL